MLFGIVIASAVVGAPKDVNAIDTYLTYEELRVYSERQAEIEWSNQLVNYANTLVGKRTGHCVLTLRNYFGVSKNEVQGSAKSTQINSKTGKVGAVIVFRGMSKWGHVAYQITPVRPNGDFEYFAGNENGSRSEIAMGRAKSVIKTINISDPRISGYRIINYN